MAHWLDSIGNWMMNSGPGQCITYFIAMQLASIAVLLVDDWYKRSQHERRESSIAELEALFALPDARDCKLQRR
ncbi:MAG TPA: hypothetical protein VL986_11380 [Terracidiphilus sp.]|nr:hypothetical protein [Terracidiphilus sp.]